MYKKRRLSIIITTAILALIAVLFSVIIVDFGSKAGLMIIIGILALSLLIICVLYPEFSFYATIVFAFFQSDLNRLLGSSVPLASVIDVLILVTFFGILFKKVTHSEEFWKNCDNIIVYAYGIYGLYTILQIFNPYLESVEKAALIIRKFILLLLFFYSLIQMFSDYRSIKRFFIIFFILSLLTALYGCYEQWMGLPSYELDFIQSDPLLIGLYKLDNGDFRKFSFLGDPKEYGLFMSASGIITLVFLLSSKLKKSNIIYLLIAAIIFLLAMTYSGTRTANFMLVMGIFLYILMTLANKKTLVFAGIFFILFVVILYAPIYGNVTINRVRSTFDLSSEASLKVRDINRHNIQPYMHSHPFGGGLGTTGILNMKDNPTHPLSGFPTDSGFLQTALEAGWIGFLIQCLVYFIAIQQGISAFFKSDNSKYKALILASIIGIFTYVVAQYAQVAIGAPPSVFMFYGLIITIFRLPQIEKEEKSFDETDQ